MDKEEIRSRFRERHKTTLKRAKEIRKIYPNPVQALVELFSNVHVDNKSWIEVIKEPYG